MNSAPTITPEIAWHVLWHYGHGGIQPGTFIQNLITAMDTADVDNLAILTAGYPELGAAIAAAKYDPNGIAELQRIGAIA